MIYMLREINTILRKTVAIRFSIYALFLGINAKKGEIFEKGKQNP